MNRRQIIKGFTALFASIIALPNTLKAAINTPNTFHPLYLRCSESPSSPLYNCPIALYRNIMDDNTRHYFGYIFNPKGEKEYLWHPYDHKKISASAYLPKQTPQNLIEYNELDYKIAGFTVDEMTPELKLRHDKWIKT